MSFEITKLLGIPAWRTFGCQVEPTERPSSSESTGLVGALAKALANRQKQIHGSGKATLVKFL